jgi:nucleotide-binding universal stress UspA family protein
MLSRILVGFDGSERALDALALGRLLSAELDGHLIVAHHPSPPPVAIPPAAAHEIAQREAEIVLDRARLILDDVDAEFHWSVAPSAAAGLYELAASERADVIVIGSCHRGPIGRLMLGSVGERLLHGAPCAVSVAPPGFEQIDEPSLRKIGVGYEPEPEAEAALRVAEELAAATGAELELICGVSNAPGVAGAGFAGYGSAYLVVARQEWAQESLEKAVANVRDEIHVTPTLVKGEPAHALVEASERLDLLVVGSRGYGPLHYVLAGGVSGLVMRKAACPVLVVPRSATSEARAPSSADHGASPASITS